jgi:predicted alpha/beta superfamily hydrolase
MLDGKRHIHHVSGIVEYLHSVGRMPEIIIVGIHSINRYSDYTPDKLEHHAGTGGAGNFTRFLEEELLKHVERNYRVRDFRMIFGHSYGGSYVMNLAFTNPEMFGGYIAASPNLFILSDLEWKVERAINNKEWNNRKLHFAVGEYEKDFIEITSGIMKQVPDDSPVGRNWIHQILENENHSSTPHKTIYSGLKMIFQEYWLFGDDIDKEKLKAQFDVLSNRLGYEILVPLGVLVNLGNNALGNDKLDQARSIFELLVELYPESEWGYVSLGSVFYKLGNKEKAIENFHKALEINPDNQYTLDMLRELDAL